jgi:hypothetical protein
MKDLLKFEVFFTPSGFMADRQIVNNQIQEMFAICKFAH